MAGEKKGDLTLRDVLVDMAGFLELLTIEWLDENNYFDHFDIDDQLLVGDMVEWVKDELERLTDSPEKTGWVRGLADSPLKEGFYALQSVAAMNRSQSGGKKPRRRKSSGRRRRKKSNNSGEGQRQQELPEAHPEDDLDYSGSQSDFDYLSDADRRWLAQQAADNEARQARDSLSHHPSRDYGDYLLDNFDQF